MDEPGRGEVLVAIAREAIAALDDRGPGTWEHDWLRDHGASFVTLRLEGELRGCIGSVEPHRPLGDDVARNGRAAAFHDPRFTPVSRAEIAALQVEISVLSPREAMTVASEAEALSRLRPGVDGILLEFRSLSATFLPQVWDGLPEPARFLGELRRKAGLPVAFWHPEMKLYRYTVEKYR